MKGLISILTIALFFVSCSTKAPYIPPVAGEIVENSTRSTPLNRADLVKNLFNPLLNSTPLPNLTLSQPSSSKSTPLTIINPRGSSLTVWALAEGNWIWGYTLDNSKDFGRARTWQVLNLGGDIVLISNALTGNCIHDEGRGITHRRCDINNKSQQWQLFAMDNGAVQLKSTASGKCIQSELGSLVDTGRYFSITMQDCNSKPNLNQQWIFAPEAASTFPLLGDQL